MSDFWKTLYGSGKPVIGLSPMDGVTDVVMRYMTAEYSSTQVLQSHSKSLENRNTGILGHESGVDVLFTEFVSVDALSHARDEKSVDRVMRAFLRAKDVDKYSSAPVFQYSSQSQENRETGKQGNLTNWPFEVAQVFGHTPELFYQAAVMIATLGYDGMDINMGCPMHKVEDQGSGAGLIRTPEVAQEIIRQSRKGMEDFASGKVSLEDLNMSPAIKNWVRKRAPLRLDDQPLSDEIPVSVKTRIGVDHDVVEEWMTILMEVKPANISLHGRTLRQLYQGSADWEAIGRAARVVHKFGGHILGNGDVESMKDATFKIKKYGVDGVLIGRAAEGNPGVFVGNDEPSKEQRLAWMREHVELHEQIFKPVDHNESDISWFMPIRKHLAWYCKGFPGAVELRSQLMLTNSAQDVGRVVSLFV